MVAGGGCDARSLEALGPRSRPFPQVVLDVVCKSLHSNRLSVAIELSKRQVKQLILSIRLLANEPGRNDDGNREEQNQQLAV